MPTIDTTGVLHPIAPLTTIDAASVFNTRPRHAESLSAADSLQAAQRANERVNAGNREFERQTMAQAHANQAQQTARAQADRALMKVAPASEPTSFPGMNAASVVAKLQGAPQPFGGHVTQAEWDDDNWLPAAVPGPPGATAARLFDGAVGQAEWESDTWPASHAGVQS